jgi:hypothetical protein
MDQPARHFAESLKAYYTVAKRGWVAKPIMKMKNEYWPGHRLFAKSSWQNHFYAHLRVVSGIAYSIKGNVKENISPSAGSGEELLDFQPLRP